MIYFIVVTESGGFSTLKFNNRQAVMIYDDPSMAVKALEWGSVAGNAKTVMQLEADNKDELKAYFRQYLTPKEKKFVEFLTPTDEDFWVAYKAFDQHYQEG